MIVVVRQLEYLSNCLRITKLLIMPFYAVRSGRMPGIYSTWDECKHQVDKFPMASYKKFATEQEAREFVGEANQVNEKSVTVASVNRTANKPQKEYSTTSTNHSSMLAVHNNVGPLQTKTNPDIQKQVAQKQAEVLQEELALLEQKRVLLEKRAELKKMQEQMIDVDPGQGKMEHPKHSVHHQKPYRHKQVATSSNQVWKKNKTTILINELQMIHSSAQQRGSDMPGVPVVYTDGACFNNGFHGAAAGIGVYWGPDHPLNTSERLKGRQTNNRAEIHAVVKAVQQAKHSGFKELTVKTDSMFLINSMTKWLNSWQRNGWRTASGQQVINREDFEALLKASADVKINWVHVRGHQGTEGNEMADRLANEGAAKCSHD